MATCSLFRASAKKEIPSTRSTCWIS
jgi:hypothetical protein